MELVAKDGERIARYRAESSSGIGDRARVGSACRLKDGSMVYVPEGDNVKVP
jgi:hypothetical protein